MQEIGSDAAVATGQSRRRGRPLARVQLQPEQSAELQRRVRAATSTQREALRARIILACAEGLNTPEAARICGTHVRTVERWRSRFLRLGLKGLKDRPRPGHKPKFGPVVRLQLIALACEPMESENGVSRRTIEQLRQVSISQGIVEGISWSSVQRILAQAELRPHLVRGWMHSPDPEFREKVTEITELYLKSTTRRSRALCRRKNRHAGLGAPLCRPASRSASCSTSRVRVQATRNPVTVLRFRCSHGTSRGELRRSAKGARPRPLYGKSRYPLPQRQSAHHLGQSQYPLRRTRGSLERFQSSPRRSLHPPLHSKTRLMGQPGGVVFQHFTKAMLARRPLLLSRRASGRSARVHRLLEPRKGPSLPVDFHRLSATIWHRVRKSFLKMSYENPQALLDEQTYRPTSPAAV